MDVDPPQVIPPTHQPAQPQEAQGRSQGEEASKRDPESGEATADTVTVSVAPPSTTEAPAQPLSPTADSANTGMSLTHSQFTHASCISSSTSFPPYCTDAHLSIPSISSQFILAHSSLICSLPPPPPFVPPPLITSTLAFPSSPRYSLRPRNKDKGPDVVGLDSVRSPITLKTSRGRPSRITKARHTADEEVALGRQQTIFGALRAKDGPPPLPS